jgi:hypothetical protein
VVTGSKPNNVDNLNDVRREASKYFRNKNKEYLRAKIDELETYNMIKYNRDPCMGINDFERVYQLRTNIEKDEKGDFFTDSQSIECKWG